MKSVAVVDDDSEFISMIRAKLTKEGIKSIGLESGKDALAYFKKESGGIGLILVDLLMPEMSGWVLVNELKKLNITNVPIIVLTNLAHTNLPEDLEMDIEMLIKTDVSMKQLVETIRIKLGSG